MFFFQMVPISDLIIYVFLGNLILEHTYFLSLQFIASTIKKIVIPLKKIELTSRLQP